MKYKVSKHKIFIQEARRFFWAIQPLLALLALLAVSAFYAWVIFMWLTEPSLTGNY